MNFIEKNFKWFCFGALFLVCLNFFTWKEVFNLSKHGNLKVEFLNVGQGDSAFIITQQNHQILIDGGPTSVVLEKIAKQMPFWDKSLDLVILSHPEKDHMQGLIEVLSRYKVDYILWSGVKKSDPEYKKWLEVLINQQKRGAKIITAVSGQEIKAGNLKIDILNPQENLFGKEMKDTSNSTSVVVKLIYGQNSFLFTGDIDSKIEQKWCGVGPRTNLTADVLKVAHHGSKYSSSDMFLQEVKPKIAVICVGKNTYGHPTPETLSRLANVGAKILRTDQLGDIIIESNGQNIYLIK